MDTSKDMDHIKRTLAGDSTAFAYLVDRYKDLVFTLSLRMVKSREDAEEVAQDVFLKAYKSLRFFKGQSKFSTWLYRIGYNTCLDYLKKRNRSVPTVEIDEINFSEIKTIETVLDSMERKEYIARIKSCLDQLPGDEGYLVTLYYFEELSVDEIAKTMGLTKSNVKVKLHRARKKLFSILSKLLDKQPKA